MLIHCQFPGIFGEVVKAIARCAVPFFFIVSGYFSYRDNQEDMGKSLKRTLKKIGVMTGRVTAFYFVLKCAVSIFEGLNPLEWLRKSVGIKDIIYLIVFNRAVFISSILWYFLALIYVLVIYIILSKIGILNKVVELVALPLLVVGILAGEWIGVPWFVIGNFLIMGLPFFSIGYLMKKYEFPEKVNAKYINCAIFFGVILCTVEYCVFGDVYLYLGSIFLAIGLFLKGFKIFPNEDTWYVQFGMKCSSSVFVIHCGIIIIMDYFVRSEALWWLWAKPFIVVLGSIVIAIVWKNLKEKKEKKHLANA